MDFDMKNLPKLPKHRPGVLYPLNWIDEVVYNVEKTDPQEYVDQIKLLLLEVNDYVRCLEYKGYRITGNFKDGIEATKTIILK
jgi:hypothetical protein